LGAKARDALFSKARIELRTTRFDWKFLLLQKIYKSGDEMIVTGAELFYHINKRGEEKLTEKRITNKLYGSVIPSRGELLSVSAKVNRRAEHFYRLWGRTEIL
jgi:hypothetical protein